MMTWSDYLPQAEGYLKWFLLYVSQLPHAQRLEHGH
jgi:hypothetical protein